MPTRSRSALPRLAMSALALLVGAASLAAQADTAQDTLARDTLSARAAPMPSQPAVRRGGDVAGLRSPLAAGVLDFFVPIAGHAYAGRWTRGIPSATVTLVSATVAAAAAGQCAGEVIGALFQGEEDPCREEARVTNVALVVFAASRVWGAVSAALTADAHNRRILDAATLDVVPRAQGAFLVVTVRW